VTQDIIVPQLLNQKPSVGTKTRVEEIQKIHEQVKTRIEKSNQSYQTQANNQVKRRLSFNKEISSGFIYKKRDFRPKEKAS